MCIIWKMYMHSHCIKYARICSVWNNSWWSAFASQMYKTSRHFSLAFAENSDEIVLLSKLTKLNWFMSKATYFLISWNHGDIMLKPTQKEPSWSCVLHFINYFSFSPIFQACFHVRWKLVLLHNYSIWQALF